MQLHQPCTHQVVPEIKKTVTGRSDDSIVNKIQTLKAAAKRT
jgi:hypothetical protein